MAAFAGILTETGMSATKRARGASAEEESLSYPHQPRLVLPRIVVRPAHGSISFSLSLSLSLPLSLSLSLSLCLSLLSLAPLSCSLSFSFALSLPPTSLSLH